MPTDFGYKWCSDYLFGHFDCRIWLLTSHIRTFEHTFRSRQHSIHSHRWNWYPQDFQPLGMAYFLYSPWDNWWSSNVILVEKQ